MSTFGVSASGDRGYTISRNEQSTNVSTPSKAGDHVTIQMGPAKESRLILPLNARLERIKHGQSEYLRLVLPGGSGMVFMEAGEAGWPHVFLHAGKHLTDPYAAAEVVEVVHERVGDLIPPTE